MSKQIQKNGGPKQSNKPTSEDKWLGGHPTRLEVANYVNALWERHYLPTITNYIQMSSMVLQAILIEKGICTGDEIKNITEKFVSEQQKRMALDTLEDGLVSAINKTVNGIQDKKWGASTEKENTDICSALRHASKTLIDINLQSTVNVEDIQSCIGELESIQSLITNGGIKSDNDKFIDRLTWVLSESIYRLNQKLSLKDEDTAHST